MIAWMEECCMECVQPKLEEGFGTVGTLVNVTHEAPTPVGCEVTINCFLRQVDGRRLVFAVEASDKGGIIGRGSHERFIVDGTKFQAKCDKKKDI
jgi:predicted thioesterase